MINGSSSSYGADRELAAEEVVAVDDAIAAGDADFGGEGEGVGGVDEEDGEDFAGTEGPGGEEAGAADRQIMNPALEIFSVSSPATRITHSISSGRGRCGESDDVPPVGGRRSILATRRVFMTLAVVRGNPRKPSSSSAAGQITRPSVRRGAGI